LCLLHCTEIRKNIQITTNSSSSMAKSGADFFFALF
jgi:hypothetical protein